MPYIDKQTRAFLNNREPQNVGELNYLITKTCLDFVGTEKSYALYNAVVGALESAKLEFYRRVVAPYEDEKIKENGDVY